MKNYLIYYTYLLKYYLYFSYKQLSLQIQFFDESYLRRTRSFERFSKIKGNIKKTRAIKFALLQHHKAGQRYDKKYPYFYHLEMVYGFVEKFEHLLINDKERFDAFLGALFHDFLEDLTFTYNDIKVLYGIEVADIVFACTELRGKNRKERHGPEYMKGLQESRLGTYVKLCDLCANMAQGKATGSGMYKKYQQEYPGFKKALYKVEFNEIFLYIEETHLIK